MSQPEARESQNKKYKALKKGFLDARNLIDASLDSLVALDRQGKIIDVNKAVERITERTKEELIGSAFEDHFTERGRAQESYQLVFKQGFLKDYPLTICSKAGRLTKLLFNASVFQDEAGEVEGMFAAARDITGIEKALNRAERHLASILHSITDAFFTLDKQWNFGYLNEKAEELMARPPGELQGKNIWSEFPEQIGARLYREYHKVMAKQAPAYFEEHSESFHRWFWVHIYPYEGGLSVYFSDITERKKTEKAVASQVRQQASVSELGQHALSDIATAKLFNEAAVIVASCLNADYAEIFESLPGGQELILKTAFGIEAGLIGKAKISAEIDTQAGYTLQIGRPVFVEDLSKDARLRGPQLLRDLGVVSGISVIIPGPEPYGILAAHTRRKRVFTDEEINFLQAIANILSSAVSREDEKARRLEFENAISQSEEKYRRIVTTAQEGIWTIDAQNRTSFVNDAMAKMLGYSKDEMLGKSLFDFMDEEGIEIAKANIDKRSIAEIHELKFRRKDGSTVWTSLNTNPLLGKRGEYEGSQAMITDITERREQNEKIKFMAFHDLLTGLPNRALFDRRLAESLDFAKEHKDTVGLLRLDLDNFKTVKNTIGHTAADELLTSIVEQIKNLFDKEGLMARVGEDEFFVILPRSDNERKNEDAAVDHAKNIVSLFARPWKVANRELKIAVNVGLAVYPKDGSDVKTLRESTDIAMLRAKYERGPNSFKSYDKSMKGSKKSAGARLDVESRLANALERQEFELYYQPVFDAVTKDVAYAEALIRWNSREGLIGPSKFIPIAEETGQIAAITQWVAAETCRKHREWFEKGFKDVKTTVNLSASIFQLPKLASMIADFLIKESVDPKYLGIEITESAIMVNPALSIKTMTELKHLGLSLHLDDFGTGYSSLSYIKQFPIDEIKIDMSFIEDLLTDPASAAIVDSIITLSHGLRMHVTAEGVERKDQYERLKALECDYIQGFLFSKPLPAREFERLLFKRAKAA